MLGLVGCRSETPVQPAGPPRVSFVRLATLAGELALSNKQDAWSPIGRRLAYQRWNGSNFDLLVYDAEKPNESPVVVCSGEYSRIISWAPDSQWLLCVMQAAVDRYTNFYSLQAFPATAGATAHEVVSRTEINWGVWGANGNIYWWLPLTCERQRLAPPPEWTASKGCAFPDRPTIIYLADRQAPSGFRVSWFHTAPEEETRFDFRNPGQEYEIASVYDVFPDGLRFLASIPSYCEESAAVDERGKIITRFNAPACQTLPFRATAVTSNGQFVVGTCELSEGGPFPLPSLYLSDALAAWRIQVEGAPQGWTPILSKSECSLALATMREDSIYVGNLEFAKQASGTH